MLRSRRFALVAVAAILGLSACGDATDTTAPADSPAVIVLGGGAKMAAPEGAAVNGGAADRSMMIGNITYVFDGTLPDLGGSAPSWTLPAGANVDAAVVARLAKVLGVTGEPRQLPADQGGGWMVGPADYSGAAVTVSGDGMVSWWYNPAPVAPVSTPACAYPDKGVIDPGSIDPAVSETAVGAAGSDAAGESDAPVAPVDAVTIGTDGTGTIGTVTEPIAPCPAPLPPEGVPTKAEAETKATQLMRDLGLDPANYELTTYADEWGANVTAWLLVGGHRSPLQFNVGYGGAGALQWASGSLAVPQPSSDYPLVTTADALQRLNDQNGMWGGYYGGIGIAGGIARDAVAPAEGAPEAIATSGDTVVATGSGSATATGGGSAGSAGIAVAPPDSILVDPMPPETITPEPITVHLTGVRLDTTLVWAEDGTIWLLPAYTFTGADGGEYTVIAVEDQYLQQPAPVTVDTTIPVDSVPVDTVGGSTIPVDSVPTPTSDSTGSSDPGTVPTETVLDITVDQAQVLVGLGLDEATKVADGNGWILRVSTLDGESQIGTADLRTNRVNVAVVAGSVTGIDSIG
ncbi:MAG: hypothetical protein ACOYMR_17845 [Ilumatobacteraceae bacterium]